jgi:chromosome partitioning protein
MGQDPEGAAQPSDSPVVAVMNGKGGVGKSTLALGLCAYTAHTHGTGLLVDCDPQGTSYEITGLLADPGYEVMHELDASQLDKIRRLRGYDLIVVDCPGSLEGHDVLAAVLACTDFALIPYDHEVTSLPATVKTAHFAAARGVPCAVVVNNVDPRLGAAHLLDAWARLDDLGVPHFRTAIRRYRVWSTSLAAGVPITRYAGHHARDARDDLAAVMTELLRNMP